MGVVHDGGRDGTQKKPANASLVLAPEDDEVMLMLGSISANMPTDSPGLFQQHALAGYAYGLLQGFQALLGEDAQALHHLQRTGQ